MSGSKARIYSVSNASFSVGGDSYDVSSVVLTLAVSAIPEAQVSISPMKSSEGKSTVRNMSVGDLSDSLSTLLTQSSELTPCNLRITVTEHDAKSGSAGEETELALDGWLLVSAGLSNLTTTSDFELTVTIVHPVYKLTLYGGYWTNFNCSPNLFGPKVQAASNILEAGVAGYSQVLEALNKHKLKRLSLGKTIPPASLSQARMLDIVKARFASVPGDLGKYLKWTPSLGGGTYGFPCWSCLTPGQKKAMKELCAESWVNPEGSPERSVWDAFMSIISTMDCVMVPTFYQEQMPVCPRFPWMPVDFTVEDEDAYSVTLPGTDPNPIFGIGGTPNTVGGGPQRMVTYAYNNAQLAENRADATSFTLIPERSYNLNGKFLSVSVPGWLTAVIAKGAAYRGHPARTVSYDNAVPRENPPTATENTAMKSKNDAEMLYLSSVFSKLFKQHVEARVDCRFMTKIGGKWILPTNVLSFHSGKDIFEGYITSVVHSISAVSSYAVTNIAVAHCRPPGGYPVTNEYGYKHPTFAW